MKILRSLYLAFFLIFSLLAHAQDLETIGKTKPITVNGNLSLTNSAYGFNSKTLQPRGNPFSSIISGNFNTTIYGVSLPFSFTYGNQERSYRQPFNQFGVNPKYKWISGHLGYTTMNFSPYTLAGHTFFGAGVELNPKKLRFAFMYGRLNRKIDQTDPVKNIIPTYLRKGFSTRIGYGTEQNHFDVILLKAKDDATSIIPSATDTLTRPAENLCAGFSSRLNKGKLFFETDMAFSIYTQNTLIDTNSLDKFYSSMLKTNGTTSQASAINASLGWKEKTYGLRIKYTRIDPKYQTMGTYFLNNDYENITLMPNASLWKKKLILNGSMGFQRNNLSNTNNTTSLRKIGSANVAFNPTRKFSLTGNYSNYASDQRSGKLPLVDSLRVYQVNQNMMLMPRLTFVDTAKVQVIMLIYNTMWLQDKNPSTAKYSTFSTNNVILNYSRTKIRSGLTLNTGLNYSLVKLKTGDNLAYGLTWGLSKSFLKNKLTTTFTNVLNRSSYSGENGNIVNVIASVAYSLEKHHAFNFNFSYNGNYTKSTTNPSFSEFRGDFIYIYRFGK